jgi:hypothetical protein
VQGGICTRGACDVGRVQVAIHEYPRYVHGEQFDINKANCMRRSFIRNSLRNSGRQDWSKESVNDDLFRSRSRIRFSNRSL